MTSPGGTSSFGPAFSSNPSTQIFRFSPSGSDIAASSLTTTSSSNSAADTSMAENTPSTTAADGTPAPSRAPRRKLVGVSTKMYFSLQQTAQYLSACLPLGALASSLGIELFVVPDFLSLPAAGALLRGSASAIVLGAQDCAWEDRGALTGEVSPADLRELGVGMVELGHAERRRWFGEGEDMVGWKAEAAERNGMVPLVCVGEVGRGAVDAAVEECRVQVESVLGVTRGEVVFAYEPVWAIGQSEAAGREHVVGVVRALRAICEERGRGADVRFLYGGSAGPGTYSQMSAGGEGVDGLFLGRFAHEIASLEKVIKEVGGLSQGVGLAMPSDLRYHV